MDPLSIAATVAGLVSFSIEAGTAIGEYYSSAKNAPTEIQNLKSELESLSMILKRLENVLRSDQIRCDSFSFDTSSVLTTALNSCDKTIRDVSSKLARPKDSGVSRMWERLTWPFNEKEVQKLLETLRRYILTFQFSLTVEGCNLLSKTSENVSVSLELQLDTSRKVYELTKNIAMMTASAQEASKLSEQVTQILKLISSFRDNDVKLDEISREIQSLTQTTQDQKESQILDWLSTYPYSQKHHDVRAGRVPGSGQWLLHHAMFQAWLDGDSQLDVLFLVGDPGAGKSILTSIMIDHLFGVCNASGTAFAYFYFDYSAQDLQTPNQFLSTILRQFITQKNSLNHLLGELYERCRKDRSQATVGDFLQMCRDLRTAFENCFILVDGLDESDGKKHRKEILDILKELELVKFKIAITSRPHLQNIKRHFQRISQLHVTASEKDIRSFCFSKFEENEDIRDLVDDKLQEEIVLTMAKNAQGMFLLPVLQMQTIMHQMTKADIRRCLRNFSTNLDQIFEESIQRIKNESRNRQQVAIESLMWITLARRPLNIHELRHALATRPEDTESDPDNLLPARSIVECCSGLVVLDDESSTFRLVHFTLQEYLLSRNPSFFPDGDRHITRTCLTYLSFDCFANPSTNMDFLHRIMETHPLLQYASCHWGHHASNSRDDEMNTLVVKYITDNSKRAISKGIRDISLPQFIRPNEEYMDFEQIGGLHTVAYFGLDHLVDLLVRNGEGLDDYDSLGNTALHETAVYGQYAVAKALLHHQAKVDVKNLKSNTALFLAASRSQSDLLELLLAYQATPNIHCVDHWTPLHKASDSGQLLNVKLLLKHGASVTAETARWLTPLHRAAGRGHLEIVRLLLQNNAPVDSRTFDDWTPLAGASSSGCHDVVRLLLQNGALVDSRGTDKRTPLHRACRGGHRETVLALLESGADALAVDIDGQIPLHRAAKGGHDKVVQILIEHTQGQLFFEDARGFTAQQEAFAAGHWETARFLREEELHWCGHPPEKSDELTCAIAEHDLKKVKELVKRGLDINRRNLEGFTPLHQALQKNDVDVGLVLLQGGAEIEAQAPDGWRPLHFAASSGAEAPIRLCIDHQSNLFAKTVDGQTALHKACRNSNIECVRLLLEKGLDIETADAWGFTPLCSAAAAGHEAIVKLLLEKGAKIDTKSKDGLTVQAIAARSGHYDVVEFIREQQNAVHRHHETERSRYLITLLTTLTAGESG